MAETYNLSGMRELKLGSTFSNPKNSSFHTLKYDFKPASLDAKKIATVDIGQDSQVTVTVPNLDGAATSQTVFKGNQKEYTRECVLVVNHTTGVITLETLSTNVQVKNSRSEREHKPEAVANNGPKQMENNTQRQSTKTKVTAAAKKNTTAGFPSKPSPSNKPAAKVINGPKQMENNTQRQSTKTKVTAASRKNATAGFPSKPSPSNKPAAKVINGPKQMKNKTKRQSTKTKVTTAAKKNTTAGFPPKLSPIQGTPTCSKAAQSASHKQSSLTSVPMIGKDDPAPVRKEIVTAPAPAPAESLKAPPPAILRQDNIRGLSPPSSSSSSDSGSSDSDSDVSQPPTAKHSNGNENGEFSSPSLPNDLLNGDLYLSESNSDSE